MAYGFSAPGFSWHGFSTEPPTSGPQQWWCAPWFGSAQFGSDWWGECGGSAGASTGGRVRGRKPLRVRRKHYVEIDGEYFEVSGPREAEAILARVRELAQEAAKSAVRKAQRKSKGKVAPPPVAPRLALRDPDYADLWTQQLQAQIDATNAAIAETYRRVALSVADWLRQESEDEDIAVLLTMGIL